ncbi:hypothetical protein D8I35_09380 [Corticibacter populi]|uniref:Uncharacterized protein n=1 Tax=Corticibacter populi TaxID=1550736 RepID=A0A3M6QW11_9BURK|nr:hypothetical protein [Corticibacter populi]RMX06702.1 hypothetical protein D8I35_09380 [Corticibacter populi]RZS31717.1 hypothetical protein EV687_2386 [Corticibacter populi]
MMHTYAPLTVLHWAICSAIGWACLCRLNSRTCQVYRRPRARYTLLLAGSFASGLQPMLFGTSPGLAETLLASAVLGSLLINLPRWTRPDSCDCG